MSDQSLGLIQQVLSQLEAINKRNEELANENRELRQQIIELSKRPVYQQDDAVRALSNLRAKAEETQELSSTTNDKLKDTANLIIEYSKRVNFK